MRNLMLAFTKSDRWQPSTSRSTPSSILRSSGYDNHPIELLAPPCLGQRCVCFFCSWRGGGDGGCGCRLLIDLLSVDVQLVFACYLFYLLRIEAASPQASQAERAAQASVVWFPVPLPVTLRSAQGIATTTVAVMQNWACPRAAQGEGRHHLN